MLARLTGCLVIAFVAVTLNACQSVVESTRIATNSVPGTVTCRSGVGSYYLPRSFLKVRIGRVSGSRPVNLLLSVDRVLRPDNYAYCIDFLESGTADDFITVNTQSPSPDVSGQFLQKVATLNVDETPLIIERVAKLALKVMTGRSLSDSDARKLESTGDFEFDPFDQDATARINQTLTGYGFCLVLEGYTFASATTPQAYCNDPQPQADRPGDFAHLYADYIRRIPNDTKGVYFRARAAYQLRVYTKSDPQDPLEPWLVRKSQSVNLENISPVLSVELDRALFTSKKIALLFDSGALQTACISKGSELLGLVDIPLKIAQSIVELPADIAKLQFDNISSSAELEQANDNYLKDQKKYLDMLNGNGAVDPTGFPEPSAPTAPGQWKITPEPANTAAGTRDILNTWTGDCPKAQTPNATVAGK